VDCRTIARDNYVTDKMLTVSLVSQERRCPDPKYTKRDQQDDRPIVDHFDASCESKETPRRGIDRKLEKRMKEIGVENYKSSCGYGVNSPCRVVG